MKECSTCGTSKPPEEFGIINKKYRQSWCKDCHAIYGREYMQKQRAKDPEKFAKAMRERRKDPAEKRKGDCRLLISCMKRLGLLTVPEKCECCNDATPEEAHHEDYNFPLLVKWICRRCHGKLRRKYK